MEVSRDSVYTAFACLLLVLTVCCHAPDETADSLDPTKMSLEQKQELPATESVRDEQMDKAAEQTIPVASHEENEMHETPGRTNEESADDGVSEGNAENNMKEETAAEILSESSQDNINANKKHEKVSQVFTGLDTEGEEMTVDGETQSKNQQEEEIWTDETDGGTEQKRSGSRRFFSLMNLIKFLLNPVIEEFQEVEKSSETHGSTAPAVSPLSTDNSSIQTDRTSVSTSNASQVSEKEEMKNGTETGKKTKFQCVGRNVTENTTAVVKVVNSTVLLELLSFDKNHTSSDCVLVMFYAPWCHFCAATAPHYNAIARAFPQLEVLAVDTVHFSNLNARFGTVAVPNIMLFYQSRAAVRFNHTERQFQTLLQFITNTTGLEANSSVQLSAEDYEGPLSSTPTDETDYLLWFAWFFIIVCSGHTLVSSQAGQRAIEKVMVLWQEHQHQHIE